VATATASVLGGSAGYIRTSSHIALHTFVAETFGDTPAAIEACFSTSTPPTIDGLPSMSCWQWTTMSCCQELEPSRARYTRVQVVQKGRLHSVLLPHIQWRRGFTFVCVTTPVRFQNQWEAKTSCTSSIRRPLVSGRKKATNSCRQQGRQGEIMAI
jgi:hypothetical protein